MDAPGPLSSLPPAVAAAPAKPAAAGSAPVGSAPARRSGTPPALAVFGMPLRVFKIILFLLGLFPLARWVWLGVTNDLTANPVEFLTRSAGTWTLTTLLITLSITPLRIVLKQPGLLQVRRMCGLFAFFYAFLHFMSYVWWDQWFDPVSIFKDVVKRPFITVGFAAFLSLIPLAVTSTRGWQRRLGRRWQTLHRVLYGTLVLALFHYWWQKAGKNDFSTVLIYVAVFACLMAFRIYRSWQRRRAAPAVNR